jgi:hypothetical protein
MMSALIAVSIASCSSTQISDDVGTTAEINAESYANDQQRSGIVLLDANWGRKWSCGKYENAQLISFSFDKSSNSPNVSSQPADITIGTTSRLMVKPNFESYAVLIPPGEYVLSNFKIKVATSVSKIDYWIANRTHLIKDGKPLAGKFTVAAGEVIYIGNFGLDCFHGPTLWRYYTEGQDGFNKQLADYQSKYPFLDLTKTKFRLFETTTIGRPYELK